ncbi:MAG: hypothetical protein R2865_14540 [Deinococcales bacterium]
MGAIGIEYIRLAIPKGDSLRAKDCGRLLALEEFGPSPKSLRIGWGIVWAFSALNSSSYFL